MDNLQLVQDEKIVEMDAQHEVNEEENEHQEYCVTQHVEMQYPSNTEDAFNLYQRLTNIAVS